MVSFYAQFSEEVTSHKIKILNVRGLHMHGVAEVFKIQEVMGNRQAERIPGLFFAFTSKKQ